MKYEVVLDCINAVTIPIEVSVSFSFLNFLKMAKMSVGKLM